jgi:hypothetical protein
MLVATAKEDPLRLFQLLPCAASRMGSRRATNSSFATMASSIRSSVRVTSSAPTECNSLRPISCFVLACSKPFAAGSLATAISEYFSGLFSRSAFYGCSSVLCEVAFKRFSGQCKDFLPTVDSAKRPWPTNDASEAAGFSGRAAGGSVVPRKMAWRPAAENDSRVQGHRLALEGQRLGCPFQ